MSERKLLELQWAEFYFLLGSFKNLGVSEEDTILNVAMFLGKFAFDNAHCHKRAFDFLNKGIDSGRRWSITEAEDEQIEI